MMRLEGKQRQVFVKHGHTLSWYYDKVRMSRDAGPDALWDAVRLHPDDAKVLMDALLAGMLALDNWTEHDND